MDIEKAFQLLQVPRGASPEAIKAAYRDMVRVWHPDRFAYNEHMRLKAEAQIRLINAAYETLKHATPTPSSDPSPEQPPVAESDLPPVSRENIRASLVCRGMARVIDLLLLWTCLGIMGAFHLFPWGTWRWLFIGWASSLLWVFIEANLVSLFRTTPGKWMFGYFFQASSGNQPNLLPCLHRAFNVWVLGMAAGILCLAPFVWAYLFFQGNIRKKPMPWESSGGCTLERKACSVSRSFAGFFLAVILAGLVTMMIARESGGLGRIAATFSRSEQERQTPVVSTTMPSSPLVVSAPRSSSAKPRQFSGEKPDQTLHGNMEAYKAFLEAELARCSQTVECRPEHTASAIRDLLISGYDICSGPCENLDALPEGLRFVGVDQLAELLAEVFRTIDAIQSFRIETQGISASRSVEPERLNRRLDALMKNISGKHFGAAQAKIDQIISGYAGLSEMFFSRRMEMLPRLIEKLEAQRRAEDARQKSFRQKQLERNRKILAGQAQATSRQEAIAAYAPEDGMPIVWTPPLPPLSEALRKPRYMVYGTLEGVENTQEGIRYRVHTVLRNKPRYFLFFPTSRLAPRQFLTGEPIWMIGTMEEMIRYLTKGGESRYMPVFQAEYIE
ncbi:DnaJ domain-containing protein [Desulfatirhabdium butyrativorans]|uniref:DnaJ domain-containing protein n=1 Tax=Desulfatirhabdium butyrativorans TaxID=340467 RepID=UPI00040964EB|nr:DnaJ domain-containing protein [Desulfatirhabdium butyrativorans]